VFSVLDGLHLILYLISFVGWMEIGDYTGRTLSPNPAQFALPKRLIRVVSTFEETLVGYH